VVELIATSPASGLLPYAKGAANLREIVLDKVTSIAPFAGQSAAVETGLGLSLPKIQRSSVKSGQEVVWFSQGQYFAIGFDVPSTLSEIAAMTDQSDAWCAIELTGAGSEAVLARLVPVDLRAGVFKRGHVMRSQLGHMPLHLTRTGGDTFRLMSFRSMAGTMVHELTRAMDLLHARG